MRGGGQRGPPRSQSEPVRLMRAASRGAGALKASEKFCETGQESCARISRPMLTRSKRKVSSAADAGGTESAASMKAPHASNSVQSVGTGV